MVEKMKAIAFERATDEQWMEIAKASLSGLSLDTLVTKTIEDIELHALYTKESIKQKNIHEQIKNIIHLTTFSEDWQIVQPTYNQNSKGFIKSLKTSVAAGNEAIMYDGRFPIDWHIEDLEKLAELVIKHPIYVQHVIKDDPFYQLFEIIEEKNRHLINGAVMHTSQLLPEYENLRTIHINTVDMHHQGADAVTELAISLAMAAHDIDKVQSMDIFAKKVLFHFAIDTRFFMEIAKLRAFRILWHTFSTAYGNNHIPVPVYSETSLRSYSKIDSNVNMLRAGNEAFAAVIGGTDMLTVYPHTILTEVTEGSERFARNVQLILKEEMNIHYVFDPANGSYFIDTLTKQLVDQAWTLFLKIEESGGYWQYVTSGKLHSRIQKQYEKRMKKIRTTEKTLVGTNKYAEVTNNCDLSKDGLKTTHRFAEAYEQFYSYFKKESFKVVILQFGSLKEIKIRADFVNGFLSAGGIKTEWSPSFLTVDEGMDWIRHQSFDYGIICSSPKRTENVVHQLDPEITKKLWIDIAGNYEKEVKHHWWEFGISGCIYNGLNQIEKYTAIKNRWEEIKHEKARLQ